MIPEHVWETLECLLPKEIAELQSLCSHEAVNSLVRRLYETRLQANELERQLRFVKEENERLARLHEVHTDMGMTNEEMKRIRRFVDHALDPYKKVGPDSTPSVTRAVRRARARLDLFEATWQTVLRSIREAAGIPKGEEDGAGAVQDVQGSGS